MIEFIREGEYGSKMLRIKALGFIILTLLLVSLMLWSSAGQRELQVCLEGCPFSSIQAAIDAANPGDTIEIAPGEYAESLVIEKDLSLKGARDGFVSELQDFYLRGATEEAEALRSKEEVVIRGPGRVPGPVVWIGEAHVVLDGLSLTKDYASIQEVNTNDHGIAVQTGAQVVVKNSIIDSVGGYGIKIDSSTVTISNSMIVRGRSGIEAWGSSRLTIEDSWIGANVNIGIDIGDITQALIKGNTIYGHVAWGTSVVGSSQVRIEDNEFLQNHIAIDVGGEDPQIYLRNNQFKKNGNGIRIFKGQAVIMGNQFENHDGAVITLRGQEVQARIIQNVVSYNHSDGIDIGIAFTEISKNKIFNNAGCGIRAPTGGIIRGIDNEIHDNGQDLCPPDYPWPPGFVRGG
jgi:hypothetical protein